jgi:mannitol/fructose-specific phosphotransferase system IIA component (Ntr-type)
MFNTDACMPTDEQDILFDVKAKDKRELFELMVARLVQTGCVKDSRAALQALMDREAARPTGLAKGVACPHANCDFVNTTCTVIARLSETLDFGAQDGIPARHVFLIISPKTADGNPHITALSSIVRCYQKPELLAKLDAATTTREYLDFLRKCNES